jgi:hypothetical protein
VPPSGSTLRREAATFPSKRAGVLLIDGQDVGLNEGLTARHLAWGDADGVTREFSDALNREIAYSDINAEEPEEKLKRQGMPEHLTGHLLAMGELHRVGRYDWRADGVQRVTGRPPMSVREFVSLYAEEFGGRRS